MTLLLLLLAECIPEGQLLSKAEIVDHADLLAKVCIMISDALSAKGLDEDMDMDETYCEQLSQVGQWCRTKQDTNSGILGYLSCAVGAPS